MEGVVSMEAWALNIGFSNIYSKKFYDHAPSQIRMPDDIAAFGSTGGNKRIDLRSIRRNYGKPPQKGTGRRGRPPKNRPAAAPSSSSASPSSPTLDSSLPPTRFEQFYKTPVENETAASIGRKLGLDPSDIVRLNRPKYRGFNLRARLQAGTTVVTRRLVLSGDGTQWLDENTLQVVPANHQYPPPPIPQNRRMLPSQRGMAAGNSSARSSANSLQEPAMRIHQERMRREEQERRSYEAEQKRIYAMMELKQRQYAMGQQQQQQQRAANAMHYNCHAAPSSSSSSSSSNSATNAMAVSSTAASAPSIAMSAPSGVASRTHQQLQQQQRVGQVPHDTAASTNTGATMAGTAMQQQQQQQLHQRQNPLTPHSFTGYHQQQQQQQQQLLQSVSRSLIGANNPGNNNAAAAVYAAAMQQVMAANRQQQQQQNSAPPPHQQYYNNNNHYQQQQQQQSLHPMTSEPSSSSSSSTPSPSMFSAHSTARGGGAASLAAAANTNAKANANANANATPPPFGSAVLEIAQEGRAKELYRIHKDDFEPPLQKIALPAWFNSRSNCEALAQLLSQYGLGHLQQAVLYARMSARDFMSISFKEDALKLTNRDSAMAHRLLCIVYTLFENEIAAQQAASSRFGASENSEAASSSSQSQSGKRKAVQRPDLAKKWGFPPNSRVLDTKTGKEGTVMYVEKARLLVDFPPGVKRYHKKNALTFLRTI